MVTYPASLKAIGGAHSGIAPVNLLDVQDVNGNNYYWSDRPIFAPSAENLVIVNVPGNTGPWRYSGTQNTSYEYSLNGGIGAPVVVPCAGATSVSVTASGTVTGSGPLLPSGPDGIARDSGSVGKILPSSFAGSDASAPDFVGLVGAFCDGAGNVIQAVWLGSSASLDVPAGATQLQLGVNDWQFADNLGSFTVQVDLIGGVGPSVEYVPWILSVPELTFHRSAVTDVGNFILQNLSGDTVSRDFEKIMRKSALEGAFFVYRCWQPDAAAAWIEVHGKFTVDDVGVDTVTLKSSPAINPAEDDTPAEQYCETCQWRWSSAQCGATGTTECQYSYQTCQVPERILVVLNDYEKNLGEATASTATQVINRRRRI